MTKQNKMITRVSNKQEILPPPKVLIVDDRKENHRAIETILTNVDADFYSALSGQEALALALRHHFAVILLDVMMPIMDGFETAAILRINQETQYTPIIFITASDRSEAFEFRGYEIGAVDYLFKPIQPITLESKVKVFLELERQRQQLKQTLEDIDRLKRRNQLLLKSVGEGIVGLDIEGHITFSNPASHKLLGYQESQLNNKSIMDIVFAGNSITPLFEWMDTELYKKCSKGELHHETLGIFHRSDNRAFPVEYTATPIYDEQRLVGIVVAFQDVTERKKAEEQLARLAQHDSLTGLTNRYAFNALLSQSISRAARNNSVVALLFMDLDKFKKVNDNLGHDIGDFLLQEVALRLKQCIRDGDIISRLGGDEFTIILENVHTVRNVASVAQKVISSLTEPFSIRDNEIHIGVSIGIALYPESSKDSETLTRCADIAMYKVKESTRNGYRFFTDEMQQEVHSALVLENQLRIAQRCNQLSLFYQPQFDPYKHQIKGLEVLLRWKPNNNGYIPPGVFIPKAEEMGLIVPIGNWVIMECCQQLHSWLQAGVVDETVSVAINISMQQMLNRSLVTTLKNALYQFNLPPSCIELEITESVMMEDVEKSIKLMNEFHDLGVKISVDDFGTGYSSLSYLRQLPLDALKIDMSFIQSIENSKQSKEIVKAIIALSKTLELTVIAEGVENQEQLEFLQQLDCDVIQGFYFSQPLPAKSVEVVLQDYCCAS